MAGFVEKKFDILDRIREIRVGESSLSVTVSMGISRISGSLADKERVAADYIACMTDRYAITDFCRLFVPREWV